MVSELASATIGTVDTPTTPNAEGVH